MKFVPLREVAILSTTPPEVLSPRSLAPLVLLRSVSEDGYLLEAPEKEVSEQGSYSYFARGDVLLAKISPGLENGKAAYVEVLSHPGGFSRGPNFGPGWAGFRSVVGPTDKLFQQVTLRMKLAL